MNHIPDTGEPIGSPWAGRPAYGLTPLQEGMLFNRLLRGGTGVDIEQLVCTLHERIEIAHLARAWQEVTDRHQALRAGFRWQGIDRPAQAFLDSVPIGIDEYDLRGLGQREQAERLAAYLAEDRGRGFDLTRPPLFRLACFRMAADDFRMVWSFHHIIIDGRSIRIVLEEVFAIYEAACRSERRVLGKPHAYSQYLEWLERKDDSTAEAYWRNALKSFTSPTRLAVDREAGAGPAEFGSGPPRYSRREIRFPAPLTAELQALARQLDVTVNTILQGAWALFLSRYSGEEDVVFGATRAGRHATVPGADAMVGLFINTLPIRARVSPDTPLPDWLRGLRRQHIAQRGVEQTPLASVRAWSGVPGTSPLFESLLVFENFDLRAALKARAGDWSKREFRLHEQSGFPVTVAAALGPELVVRICCDAGRFDDPVVDRMAGHLRTLLEQVAEEPGRRLSEIPMLTGAERRRLLVDWNATSADYPRDRQVQELFDEQVEETPFAVALADHAREITYRDAGDRADAVADALRRAKVGTEEPIGLWGWGSADATIALLGILKAGAVYVPLPVDSPPSRIGAILEDAGIEHVIDCGAPEWPLEGSRYRLLSMVDLCGDMERSPQSAVGSGSPGTADRQAERRARSRPEPGIPIGSRADAVACVIYTSGTSGRPKGVAVRHRSIVNLLYYRTRSQFRPGDFAVAPLTSPLHFDGSLVQIFSPLLTGGTLVTARATEELARSPWYARLTAITGAPSLIAEIARRYGFPSSVRVIGLGAEPVPAELLDSVVKSGTIERLVTAYGMTECACYSTAAVLYDRGAGPPATTSRAPKLNDIGLPIANTQVYVLDRDRQPVPIGVPGELYIGGQGLARGYLNRPELTVERFIPSPFAPDETLYRTGDRVRWTPEGTLEFLGRVDDQVKIRGFRIEPGEVEAALLRHPAVAQAAAVARDDGPGGRQLVAYLVPAPGTTLDPAVLRRHVGALLPGYMVPAAFVAMEALPLHPNGKLDRGALPIPDSSRWSLAAGDKERSPDPRNLTERRLAVIWARLLKINRIGIRDNFFEIGGHSLLAASLTFQIERQFQQPYALKDFYEAPTIEDMAARLAEGRQRQSDLSLGSTECLDGHPRPTLFCLNYPRLIRQHLDDLPAQQLGNFPFDIPNHTSIEDMAASRIEEMRHAQREGPYLLFGYCGMGVVAFEIAQQLRLRGEEVALVILLDPSNVSRIRVRPPIGSAYVGRRFVWHLSRFAKMHPKLWPSYAYGKALSLMKRTIYRFPALVKHFNIPEVNIFWLVKLIAAYNPQKCSGQFALILSSDIATEVGENRDFGYGSLVSNLDVRVISGNHEKWFEEPHIRHFAEEVKVLLHDTYSRLDRTDS
jgi:amino acid adenylation domain-containing protein